MLGPGADDDVDVVHDGSTVIAETLHGGGTASAASGSCSAIIARPVCSRLITLRTDVPVTAVEALFTNNGGIQRALRRAGYPPPTAWPSQEATFAQALLWRKVAGSRVPGAVVRDSPVVLNGLLESCILAWSMHTPLALSPVVLWLSICQSVGTAIAKHSAACAVDLLLRPAEHGAKTKLHIDGSEDDTARALAGDVGFWSTLFPQFERMLSKVVKPEVLAALQADFEGATPTDRLAMTISVLSCAQSYVEYDYCTFCALTSVELQGSCNDWEHLCAKIGGLKAVLGPVLVDRYGAHMDAALATATRLAAVRVRGVEGFPADKEWLQGVVSYSHASGSPYIEGWILDFVWFDRHQTPVSRRLDIGTMPAGYSSMPLSWERHRGRFTVMAGCWHLVETASGALGTQAAWAVVDAK
jgi:hypothetical protein